MEQNQSIKVENEKLLDSLENNWKEWDNVFLNITKLNETNSNFLAENQRLQSEQNEMVISMKFQTNQNYFLRNEISEQTRKKRKITQIFNMIL
jgi:hypothetical protein